MPDTPDRLDGLDDLRTRAGAVPPPEAQDVHDLSPEEVRKLVHELRAKQAALEESERKLRSLFDNMHSGFAYHEVITDDQGQPIDYVFLEVNAAFERMTGLKGADIVGQRVTEVHPGIESSEFDWIGVYGEVALTGEPVEFEQFFPPQEHWYKISAYSPERGFFACVVEDITEHKLALEKRGAALAQARQRQGEVAALLGGARAVLDCHTFEDAARHIFDACTELIGATSGYVALLSDDGEENEVLFLEAGGLPCTVDPGLPMPIRGLRGEAYEKGKVVYDNDFANSEWMQFMPEGHVRLDNVLFAPLIIAGQTVGLMGIANKPGGFSDHDARMARAFGELAAIALRQARDEEALRESEERFRSTFEHAAVGIAHVAPDGRFLRVNQPFCNIVGYTSDELLMMTFQEITHPDDLDIDVQQTLQVLEGEIATYSMEKRYLRKDRSVVWASLTVSLAGEAAGESTYLMGVVQDISARKNAEEEIAHLALFPSENPSPVLRVERQGTVLFANVAALPLLEGLGSAIGQAAPEAWRALTADALQSASQRQFDVEHEDRVISFMVIPIGSEGYVNWYGRDVTDRRRAEAEAQWLARFPSENPNPVLRISRSGEVLYRNGASAPLLNAWGWAAGEEISEPWRQTVADVLEAGRSQEADGPCEDRILSLTFAPVAEGDYVNVYGLDVTGQRRAAQELRRSLDEKELLLKEVHHRVKNNLQVMSSLARLQARRVADPAAREALTNNQSRIQAMALIHETLHSDRDIAHVDFSRYVRNLANSLSQTYGAASARATVHVEADPVPLGLDQAVPCGQIVAELISNSLKHAFPTSGGGKGEIEVSLRKSGETLELTVSDNGIGMPEGIDIETSESLGLRLVKMLAEGQLGGSVTMATDIGTCTRITFPERR